MKIRVAETESGSAAATLRLVSEQLAAAGHELSPIALPASGLPDGVAPLDFKATASEIVESWRVARQLETRTNPGDVVLVSDHNAVGVVFALEQAAAPASSRRTVLMCCADSALLAQQLIAGTAAVDPICEWERAGYAAAAGLLATSEWVAEFMGAQFIGTREPDGAQPSVTKPAVVGLPEEVSRISRTGEILRGLAAAPDLEVRVSSKDAEDRIWRGSTWEALAGVRALLGSRLVRSDQFDEVDVAILGSMVGVPGDELRRLRASGLRFVVPGRSAAAAVFPEAPTWESSGDILSALTAAPARPRMRPPPEVSITEPGAAPGRAQRVSVGVPVFRNVEYLDECVQSILDQDQPPHEVILYDDGSDSEEVTAALASWQQDQPEVIKIMSGPNRGVCVARNQMIAAMEGDAFVLVDSDDRLDPSFISKCANALRANPGIVAVATWTEFFGAYTGVEAKPPFTATSAWDENPIISTCVLVDMAARDMGVAFSPDLAFIYCEDWDYWAQIVAAGGKFGLVPEPLAFHRAAPATGGGYLRTDLAYALGRERARQHLASRR